MRGGALATITSKGQITLPKHVRDALGLQAGSRVSFVVQAGQVILRKVVPDHVIDRWRGYLRGRGNAESTDEVMQGLRGE